MAKAQKKQKAAASPAASSALPAAAQAFRLVFDLSTGQRVGPVVTRGRSDFDRQLNDWVAASLPSEGYAGCTEACHLVVEGSARYPGDWFPSEVAERFQGPVAAAVERAVATKQRQTLPLTTDYGQGELTIQFTSTLGIPGAFTQLAEPAQTSSGISEAEFSIRYFLPECVADPGEGWAGGQLALGTSRQMILALDTLKEAFAAAGVKGTLAIRGHSHREMPSILGVRRTLRANLEALAAELPTLRGRLWHFDPGYAELWASFFPAAEYPAPAAVEQALAQLLRTWRAGRESTLAPPAKTSDTGTETVEKPAGQERPVPSPGREENQEKPGWRAREEQRRQEKPPIELEEIAQAEAEVKALHTAAVERYQQLLDSLVGRRGESDQENKEIAKRTYDLGKRIGVRVLSRDRAAYLRWFKGVFEAQTTDPSRVILNSSADFLPLQASAKGEAVVSGTSELTEPHTDHSRRSSRKKGRGRS